MTTLLENKKRVGFWIFTIKHKADGCIERYKARLVVQGFTQSYGIDYHETFATVAKLDKIKTLLSSAANLGSTDTDTDTGQGHCTDTAIL